jgi:hypothetical protein
LRARPASFQKLGFSASRLSSASLICATSKSKIPPQQSDRLLDLFDDGFDFSAHSQIPIAGTSGARNVMADGGQYNPPVPDRTARSASGDTELVRPPSWSE